MTDVLVVAGEPLWPASHGGRIRIARIVEELARHLEVEVVAPVEADPPVDVILHPLPPERPPSRPAALRPSPRLGQRLLGHRRGGVLQEVALQRRPATVLFAQSYLAATSPILDGPAVAVDFSDVEARRMASMARWGTARSRVAHGLEAVKALRWEPPVARCADLVSVTSETDAELVSSWGVASLLVPNGADRSYPGPSPLDGPVTFAGSFSYAPTLHAAAFVLERLWPRLRRAEPRLRLRLVGRGARKLVEDGASLAGAELVTDPASMERFYREASVVLAPVRAGGGSQLKVTEALARGRVVVATPFSARSAPPSAGAGLVVASDEVRFVECSLRLWRDRGERHARERYLVEHPPVPTWEEVCAPLVDRLARLTGGR